MKHRLFLIVVVFVVLGITPIFSQESASAILGKAKESAKIENKKCFYNVSCVVVWLVQENGPEHGK